MNLNKPFGSFLLIFLVLVMLFAASFIDRTQLEKFGLRKVDLLADVTAKAAKRKVAVITPDTSISEHIAADTVTAIADVIETDKGIHDFSQDTTGGLKKFFAALKNVSKEKKKIRIAYFGDSAIEGDLITQDLRSLLQRSFGGSGVGFVPVTSNVASFRRSIRHFFSSNWKSYSFLDTIKETPGISGFAFKATGSGGDTIGSWVRFEGSDMSEKLSRFYKVRLFYGKGGKGSFVKYHNAHGAQQMELTGEDMINELVLNEGVPLQNLSINFSMKDPVTIYGISFEGEDGIIIDNFAFRGNSGMPLTRIPAAVYRKFDEHLNYDLVILHYGLNVVSPSVTDFSWYEKGMSNVVEHLKASFRNAGFLMVSVSDKSYNNNGTFETDPSVPLIVEAQRKVAQQEGIAFWNLYSAMGGYNSMVEWATADTALANKDFTHFNFRGARKVGTLLYEDLMAKYNEFSKLNP